MYQKMLHKEHLAVVLTENIDEEWLDNVCNCLPSTLKPCINMRYMEFTVRLFCFLQWH